MIHLIRTTIAFGLICSLAAPGTAQHLAEVSEPVEPANPFAEQIVVQLRQNNSINSVNATFGTTTIRGSEGRGLFLLRPPPHASAQVMKAWLMNDNRVAWAEMNSPVVAPRGGTQSFFLPVTYRSFIDQPVMNLVEADAQWWTGGDGQIVAVLDTGIDPEHPILARRIAPGGYNYIDGNHDYREVVDGQTDVYFGHGTMISGIVVRIAPDVQILPMRVLNSDGIGSSFFVAQAIHDAIDQGATVINASLGSIRPSRVVAEAAAAAEASGVVVVAAAGNRNRSDPPFYPAAFESTIAVAGTDLDDVKASFSDYGTYIDLTAPAVDVVGTFPNNGYASSEGNSLAAPLVAATAALIRSIDPELSPEEVRLQLRDTADDITRRNMTYDGLLGTGRLNVFRSVYEGTMVHTPGARR